jgi:hypothetical protein
VDRVAVEPARWWCIQALQSVEQSLLLSVRAVPRAQHTTREMRAHHQVLLRSLQLAAAAAVTGVTLVVNQLIHNEHKFLEPAAVVAAVVAVDYRTLSVVKSLRKHCLLVQCRTAIAEAMQSLAPTITVLVAVVLVKQVPIARHHQCFPQPVVTAEPQTSLVLMCITQQAAVAQVDTPITGPQAAQAAVETAVDSTTTPLQQQV